MEPEHNQPWEALRRGRAIDELWLAAHMRELGIRSRTVGLADRTAKGYLRADVEAAVARIAERVHTFL